MNKLLFIISILFPLSLPAKTGYKKRTVYIAASPETTNYNLYERQTYNNNGLLLFEKRFGHWLEKVRKWEYTDTNLYYYIKHFIYTSDTLLQKTVQYNINELNEIDTSIELFYYDSNRRLAEKRELYFGYQQYGCAVLNTREWGDTISTRYKYNKEGRLQEEKQQRLVRKGADYIPGYGSWLYPNIKMYNYDHTGRILSVNNYYDGYLESRHLYSASKKNELPPDLYYYRNDGYMLIGTLAGTPDTTKVSYVFDSENRIIEESKTNWQDGKVIIKYDQPGGRIYSITTFIQEGKELMETRKRYVYE